jgi:hypothetical protein
MGSAKAGAGRLSPTLRKRLEQVKACEKSGESLKAYAGRHEISVHALYQAKKLGRRNGLLPPHRGSESKSAESKQRRPSRFVEAVRPPVGREPGPAWRLRLAGGEVLESSTSLGIDETLALIEALRGRP